MGRLVSLGLMLLVGVLVYNYFLGDEAEQEQSKAVFKQAKELGNSIKDFYKSEQQSYDEGKYKRIVDPIKKFIKSDDQLSQKYKEDVNEIDNLQDEIVDEQTLRQQNSPRYNEEKEKLLKRKLDEVLKKLSEDLEN